MVDRRIRLLSPMGWHRKTDPAVPERTFAMYETTSATSECRSSTNECASPQTLDSPSRSASTTSRRTLLGKDPGDHQPETSKQTLAEGRDKFSRNSDPSVISCTSPSSKVYARGTRSPKPLEVEAAPSSSLNPTERELAEDSRYGASFISLERLFSSCELKEEPKQVQAMSSEEEEEKEEFFPMVSEMYYLLMNSNRNRRDKERTSRERRYNRTESDNDSAYEEECTESVKGQFNDAINIPLIRIDDWDALMAHESRPDQS